MTHRVGLNSASTVYQLDRNNDFDANEMDANDLDFDPREEAKEESNDLYERRRIEI